MKIILGIFFPLSLGKNQKAEHSFLLPHFSCCFLSFISTLNVLRWAIIPLSDSDSMVFTCECRLSVFFLRKGVESNYT